MKKKQDSAILPILIREFCTVSTKEFVFLSQGKNFYGKKDRFGHTKKERKVL